MNSILFDAIALKENEALYTPEEKEKILADIRIRIEKNKKEFSIYSLIKKINTI